MDKEFSGDYFGLPTEQRVRVRYTITSSALGNCGVSQLTGFTFYLKKPLKDTFSNRVALSYVDIFTKEELTTIEANILSWSPDKFFDTFCSGLTSGVLLMSDGVAYNPSYFRLANLMKLIASGKFGPVMTTPPVLNNQHTSGDSAAVVLAFFPPYKCIMLDSTVVNRGIKALVASESNKKKIEDKLSNRDAYDMKNMLVGLKSGFLDPILAYRRKKNVKALSRNTINSDSAERA